MNKLSDLATAHSEIAPQVHRKNRFSIYYYSDTPRDNQDGDSSFIHQTCHFSLVGRGSRGSVSRSVLRDHLVGSRVPHGTVLFWAFGRKAIYPLGKNSAPARHSRDFTQPIAKLILAWLIAE